jgi:hypothetical protein
MKGDFSRDSFDPARHFTRVLLQQGRVLTDADFNEQAAIQQHFLRAFVVDLVGRRWRVGEGFAIGGATAEDFTIGAGRFYLGGMACENADACRYRTQPAGPARADDGPGGRAIRPRVRPPISTAGSGRSRPPRTIAARSRARRRRSSARADRLAGAASGGGAGACHARGGGAGGARGGRG